MRYEYYLTGWRATAGQLAGLLNITQVHDAVVTGEGTLDCDAAERDWWINQKVASGRMAAPRGGQQNARHGITVQNSYPDHPPHLRQAPDLLNQHQQPYTNTDAARLISRAAVLLRNIRREASTGGFTACCAKASARVRA